VKAQIADLPRAAARVDVRLNDGRSFSETVLHAVGSEQRPLTDADIEAKVRSLAKGGAAEGGIEELIAFVWRLDEIADVRPYMPLLAGKAP
jgi:2-methylcitrate dehydratase PrpD